ncbi:MAG: T9SS type A sorting domain-containing protein [Bacteroidota bacterium]
MKKFIYLLIFLFSFNISFGQVLIDTALNFSVKDIYGNNIELFSILDEGKLVAINFFSTSCGPCGLYAPDFQASYEDFGENAGNVYFLGMCWGDDNTGVAYFDSIHGITHPSVSGSEGGGNQVHNNYQVMSTPTVILINPEREIIEHHIWEPTHENINAAILAAGGSMLGIHDPATSDNSSILIYPNPASDRFTVQMMITESAKYHIEVFNLLGSGVYKSKPEFTAAGTHMVNADCSTLPGGTYFVRVLKDGQHHSLGRLILLD